MRRASKDREKPPRRVAARRPAAPKVDSGPPALRLLGGFELRAAGGGALPVSARKPAALLAYLALQGGAAVPRDKLATMLWEDRAQAQARGSLRQALTVLRKLVPAGGLAAETESVTLRPGALEVDAVAYRTLLDAGDGAALERAVELYRGDLLDGFHAGAPLFEEWLLGERELLRQRALEALAGVLALQRAAGHRQRAIRTAVRLLSLDPLQEEVHRTLMHLHAEAGQRGAALRSFPTSRRRCFPASAAFMGPIILGFIAGITDDDAERRAAIADAERLLAAGSVSHNHLAFHPLAMDAWLAAGAPERVEHHAAALERYTADEPLLWSTYFAAWGRALSATAQGDVDRAELTRLHAEATRGGLGFALPRLEAALR